ncbi:hypothetical protein LTR08_001205 [Meristemomyces frigidus]|nr:hypothetical protein LTR08_001205 [Meristemomyces frigidus]
MPPAISDDESASDDVPDMIPARGKAKANPEPEEDEPEAEPEAEDEDDGGEDEYRVEKILNHEFTKDGAVLYQIKWLGYEEESDMTLEPIENLDGAKEIVKAYHKKIGGEPVYEPPARSQRKKGRASGGGKRSASSAFAADSPVPTSNKKKGRKSNGVVDEPTPKRVLPPGSWDNDVLRVTSVVEETVPIKVDNKGREKDERELMGLLEWKDGMGKTQHKMKVLRQKAPQRLLDYYEQHLVFTQASDAVEDARALDTKMEEAEEEAY